MERLKHIVQVDIVLGAWLIVAPFVMGYSMSRPELANDIALGVLLIACSWWILAADSRQVGAAGLALLGGLWLIGAPFVLHDARLSRPFDTNIVVGVLAVLVSARAAWMLASNRRRAARS